MDESLIKRRPEGTLGEIGLEAERLLEEFNKYPLNASIDDQRILNPALDWLRETPTGAAVVDFLERSGTTITLDHPNLGNASGIQNHIRLNKHLPPATMGVVLAHEAMHILQSSETDSLRNQPALRQRTHGPKRFLEIYRQRMRNEGDADAIIGQIYDERREAGVSLPSKAEQKFRQPVGQRFWGRITELTFAIQNQRILRESEPETREFLRQAANGRGQYAFQIAWKQFGFKPNFAWGIKDKYLLQAFDRSRGDTGFWLNQQRSVLDIDLLKGTLVQINQKKQVVQYDVQTIDYIAASFYEMHRRLNPKESIDFSDYLKMIEKCSPDELIAACKSKTDEFARQMFIDHPVQKDSDGHYLPLIRLPNYFTPEQAEANERSLMKSSHKYENMGVDELTAQLDEELNKKFPIKDTVTSICYSLTVMNYNKRKKENDLSPFSLGPQEEIFSSRLEDLCNATSDLEVYTSESVRAIGKEFLEAFNQNLQIAQPSNSPVYQ